MKKLLFSMLLVSGTLFAQVGINTTNPQAMLDVNGSVRIQNVPTEAIAQLSQDSLIVTNQGFIKKASVEDVFNETFKSSVKGNLNSASPITVSLLAESQVIPFNSELFDNDDSFDISTHQFTAKSDGIYHVSIHLKFVNTISAATNLGIRVLQNGVMVHRNSHANVTVVGTNVTNPQRSICTLLELSEDDVIQFEVEGDIALGSVDIVGDSSETYFTINRVH